MKLFVEQSAGSITLTNQTETCKQSDNVFEIENTASVVLTEHCLFLPKFKFLTHNLHAIHF